jgi:hypothetical protein
MDAVYGAVESGNPHRRLPGRGVAGLALLLAAEALLFSGVRVVGIYFTPLVWSGYILFVDALNCLYHGSSLLVSRRREFLAMLPWSIFCWCLFEAYNLRLGNWTYIGLPDALLPRTLGYMWAFATIFPAVLETADLLRPLRARVSVPPARLRGALLWIPFVTGVACLMLPLVLDQEIASKLFALVWIGFLLLLDPVNHLCGGSSIIARIRTKHYDLPLALTLSGLGCGILWEFWNYWALGKWIYSVPLSFAGPKMFEMPLLGYLGFIPFAFTCWVMQESLRLLFPRLAQTPAS